MENNIIELIRKGDIEGLRKAIEEGADINIQDEYGSTILMIVSYYNRVEIVKLLIEKKAKLDIQDKYGETALMMAIRQNNFEIVKLLIKEGADVNIQDKSGETALDYAKEKDVDGKTALDYAKEEGIQEMVELLTNLKPTKVIVPTSKVIQISTNPNIDDWEFIALCEDGSIWSYSTAIRNENKRWTSILNNSTN